MKSTIPLLILLTALIFSQENIRVEPPFWWAGMNNPDLQLMIRGNDIASCEVYLTGSDGVELKQTTRLRSKNYLFLDLLISPSTTSNNFTIEFRKDAEILYSYEYKLHQRIEGSAERRGFDASDVMYLITPDRFANGNTGNDVVAGMQDTLDRSAPLSRHGGDIQGIINSLDYISDMGFTAIWLNPVLENNMPRASYHGYAITDFYKTDQRFGSNEQYLELSRLASGKGIKLIMDMILNHCGSKHWWIEDLPSSDWLNFQQEAKEGDFTITSHRKTVIQDPYVADIDLKKFTDGWFWYSMPDLNQRNPFLAKYLIQNTIWWIEYADLAGIRMDTYPYPDSDFISEWTCAIKAEYPAFNIVGEEWHNNPAIVSYWQTGKHNANGYTSCLPSLMDFPLMEALPKALNKPESSRSGWITAYETLATDFLYADPFELVVFPDNHDVSRFYTQVNENFDLFKLGITYFLTIRGVPQIYYGTEILMSNPGTNDHGIIRSDFPGGWPGDNINGFTGKGLTAKQKEAQAFLRKLLNWRKGNSVIHNGKLIHFTPEDGIYVLFRYTDTGRVMIVLNKNTAETSLPLDRFSEIIGNATVGSEVFSGEQVPLTEQLIVPPMSPLVIEFESD